MAAGKKQNQGKAVWLALFGTTAFIALIVFLLRGNDVILFNPKGLIADEQHQLMVLSTLIMLAFGIPIVGMLYYFAWKYRESNQTAKYDPRAGRGSTSAFLIWGLPTAVMIILASIMLPATQRLEPQHAIASDKEPLTIQVVAQRWKWLFIYPEQQIATVNLVQLPVDRPVTFHLTADETPMSSFWIPHLGGMLYAMTGHVNQLNLMPNTEGDYEGSAAEINGHGFAGMRFTARVSSETEFANWVGDIADEPTSLNTEEYAKLLVPSENNAAAFYSSADPEIYSSILSKYSESHSHESGYDNTDGEEHH